MSRVTIYTHPDCPYSLEAKNELDRNKLEFDEIDLSVITAAWSDVEKLTGGQRITPVIVDGDSVTIGFGGVG